jgi:hypothetical protein
MRLGATFSSLLIVSSVAAAGCADEADSNVGVASMANTSVAGPAGPRLNAPRHLAILADGSVAVSSANEDVIVRVVPASKN